MHILGLRDIYSKNTVHSLKLFHRQKKEKLEWVNRNFDRDF
ncbi:hypothetical protein P872_03270 [Rhodonellum psychrophilum GCM71 = DSM 17998]|uniref:Uncharacterized protein n=1 Tax=Rhodonellum psychrophilum GCM71 = DSM 17998 TaxID=1123057 RepID=U5C5F3_9BACT|nr:hypothetical protein P872_03270 [Rhodonellum psychrophilum GCM71 = DSM 17998]